MKQCFVSIIDKNNKNELDVSKQISWVSEIFNLISYSIYQYSR
jgi:hypothetical protein